MPENNSKKQYRKPGWGFQKAQTGNPSGRPRGVPNKVTHQHNRSVRNALDGWEVV